MRSAGGSFCYFVRSRFPLPSCFRFCFVVRVSNPINYWEVGGGGNGMVNGQPYVPTLIAFEWQRRNESEKLCNTFVSKNLFPVKSLVCALEMFVFRFWPFYAKFTFWFRFVHDSPPAQHWNGNATKRNLLSSAFRMQEVGAWMIKTSVGCFVPLK